MLNLVRSRLPLLRQTVKQAGLRPLTPPKRDYRREGFRYFNKVGAASSTESHQRYLGAAAAAVVLGAGYYVTHLETVPFTNRRRFMAVSPAAELKMGQSAFAEMKRKYEGKILHQSHPVSRTVQRVGMRIAEASGLRNVDWEFFVIDDPTVNCFVLPGGKVFVFSGMLPVMENEAGLAVVLGHEVAHQVCRHSAEKMSKSQVMVLVRVLASVFLDIGSGVSLSLQMLLMELPNSRACEDEADRVGLEILARACYDPAEAVRLWTRMSRLEGSSQREFLSTHPSNDTRVKHLSEWLNSARRTRETHCHTMDDFEAAQHQMRPLIAKQPSRAPVLREQPTPDSIYLDFGRE